MTRWPRPLLLSLLLTVVGALVAALAPWVDVEQDLGLQWLYHLRGPIPAPGAVTVVAIDEDSAEVLGVADNPRDWPRRLHAELVRELARAGARLIVFDMTFDRPSADAADDAALAAAMAAAGNVVATVAVRKDTLPLEDDRGKPLASVVVERPSLPVPVIEQALLGYAPFLLPKAARIDAYWIYRSTGRDSPTLPLLALQAWEEVRRAAPRIDGASVAPPDPGSASLARVGASGDTGFLNLYGPPRTIRTLPYSDIIEHARHARGATGVQSEWSLAVRDKAVFVGFSAKTTGGQDRLRDDHRTVFSREDGLNLSGVEIAATAFANLLEGRPLRPLPMPWQLAILAAWAAVLAIVCHLLRPAPAAMVVGILVGAYLWLVFDRFATAASWWPSIVPAGVQAPLALLSCLLTHYRRTTRERQSIERAFGYFLPQAIVDQLARSTGVPTQGNRVVYGSCLATDIAGYTTLAEHMEPSDLGRLLNAYFAELFVPVERSGGIVVDVVGDAMIAIWAAPTPTPDVRRKACEAALEIIAAIDRFNHDRADRPLLSTRFGLHTGDVLIGNVGASKHYEYRAVGDIVNTASRVQDLNKLLGTDLLATADTVAGLVDLWTRPLGTFQLPGKSTALEVVELRGHRDRVPLVDQRLCDEFTLARACHDEGRWGDAVQEFTRLLEYAPDDGPSRFYLGRCQALAASPPAAGWTPTIVIGSK